MDLEQIRQLILEMGAYRAGVVAVEDIDFQPDFRKLCESNACGMYGRNWMCPPLVGEVDQLIASLKRWRWAVVYPTDAGGGRLPGVPAVRQAGRPALPEPGAGHRQPGGIWDQRIRPGPPGGHEIH